MKKYVLMFLGIVMVVACATAPAPRQIQNTWIIPKPFMDVWQATLQTLAEMEINIVMPVDKESGLITTELKNFSDNQKACWDCGKLAFTQFKEGHRGKVTLFVRKQGEEQTELKVVANFEILFTDTTHEALTKSRLEKAVQGETIFARPCVSTGQFEGDFYQRVQAKLK